MKCEVKLYVAGKVFTEQVYAVNYQEARELAHADSNSHEVIQEWVSDWEINLITEVK